MLTPEQIEAGKSYACKFKIQTMLDEEGRIPVAGDTTLKGVGEYKGFGVIKVRDLDSRLFKVIDSASGRELVVGFEDVYDIDEANYAN